ncbi:hypothetical protein [Blastochloris sulfoviridis]|uniref:Uncharacterized protein n=1 Tax=Blastochloris sulfoviridis TaxID=50712 RepID=A0A5M6HVI4_9HYPH|nr:hypothetical protein [Blastochloris sulfoviridis]KAA5599569.1 hypothetical protein F1193_11565 [Blastochloris sulfoviridis]
MPQLWLTYEELAAFTNQTAEKAREGVIAAAWDRRRCHDGMTRVKLPLAFMADCICLMAERLQRSGSEFPQAGSQAARMEWLGRRLSESGITVSIADAPDTAEPQPTCRPATQADSRQAA